MNMLDKIDLETSHLSDEALKAHIKDLARIYSERVHHKHLPALTKPSVFEPGISQIDYAARVLALKRLKLLLVQRWIFGLPLGRRRCI